MKKTCHIRVYGLLSVLFLLLALLSAALGEGRDATLAEGMTPLGIFKAPAKCRAASMF